MFLFISPWELYLLDWNFTGSFIDTQFKMTTHKQQIASNRLKRYIDLGISVMLSTFCAVTKCPLIQTYIYRRCGLSYKTKIQKRHPIKKCFNNVYPFGEFLPLGLGWKFKILHVSTAILWEQQTHSGDLCSLVRRGIAFR